MWATSHLRDESSNHCSTVLSVIYNFKHLFNFGLSQDAHLAFHIPQRCPERSFVNHRSTRLQIIRYLTKIYQTFVLMSGLFVLMSGLLLWGFEQRLRNQDLQLYGFPTLLVWTPTKSALLSTSTQSASLTVSLKDYSSKVWRKSSRQRFLRFSNWGTLIPPVVLWRQFGVDE